MGTVSAGLALLYQRPNLTHLNVLTMKLFIFFTVGLLAATTGRAQFFRNLTDNIKQSLQNRANGKTNTTTNNLLDKIDSATKIGGGTKGTTGKIDTSGMGRVLGAFAKTAAENPNDTNRADLLSKSLSRMVGGDGVSAVDSAKAIKSYLTASGGSGVLYQMLTTTTSKRGSTRDTNSTWLTNSGEGRSEMRIPMPGVVTPKFITIGRVTEPTYSVLLDADSKTYSLNIIDTAFLNSGIEKYQVTRIGTETVAGYSCIHSRIVSTMGSGMFKSSSTMDLWTSTSVPGYATYSKLITFQSSTGGMLGALNKAGAGGYLVKMTAGDGKEYSMTMVLIKAQQGSFPASLFEIPAGYTNDGTSTVQKRN
jgi:Domain of unknown function (DUF4412)